MLGVTLTCKSHIQSAISVVPMPSQSDPTELEVVAVSALRELTLACESYRQAFADYRGIGNTESEALSYLHVRGALGQTDLARLLQISTSSATSLVDRLEANGMAERVRHPQDRRRAIVQLTSEGEKLLAESNRWIVNAFTEIPAGELAATAQKLLSMSHSLRDRTQDLSQPEDLSGSEGLSEPEMSGQ